MKYAQLLIGLFAGTALGGVVAASTGPSVIVRGDARATTMDRDAVKQIVRETINEDPKMILDAVQKYQEDQRRQQTEGANEKLKDAAIKAIVFDSPDAGMVGPKDSSRVIVEFFDYNCPACKAQFKELDALLKTDKTLRVIFREYPIFGPQSDTNAKIGLAVTRLHPEKYFDFHAKMMGHEGRADEKVALGFVKELGMDVAKVKAEAATDAVAKILRDTHMLGEKLNIQGTPTVIVGDEIVPHALMGDELISKVGALK